MRLIEKYITAHTNETYTQAQIEMALTPPMAYYLNAIYENLDEMTEQNDCYLATKLFRVLMRLVGKSFQGSANLMRT